MSFIIAGCIDVDSSPIIYSDLARAQENLVLDNELHLLYLVTPLDLRDSVEPEWMTYYRQVHRGLKNLFGRTNTTILLSF